MMSRAQTVIDFVTDLNWAMHILFNGHLVVAAAFYIASYFAAPGLVMEQIDQIALVSFEVATACLMVMIVSTVLAHWTRARVGEIEGAARTVASNPEKGSVGG